MLKRNYGEYVAAVSGFGVTPIIEAVWSDGQLTIPAPKDIDMPLSLNFAIAMAIESGDHSGASQLIEKCSRHDEDCWQMYTKEGDYFAAGGLWFNQQQWESGERPDASPMTVAHMLDFEGDLPT